MKHIEMLYVYGTDERPDGMRFAVAAVYVDESPTETIALFKHGGDAVLYAQDKAEKLGGIRLTILPSAAAARR